MDWAEEKLFGDDGHKIIIGDSARFHRALLPNG